MRPEGVRSMIWNSELLKYFANLLGKGYLYSKDTLVDLEQSQWWSLRRLEKFQDERLRYIVHYAYQFIPGYRSAMNRMGIKPSDIKSKEDLWKMPIMTRAELQNNNAHINKELITATLYTGGSTGVPLKYFESEVAGKIRWNSHLRGWKWNGYIPGKKLAIISSAQGIIAGENIITLIGDLTTENLEKNIEKLKEFKPQHIRGYVSSLYILAKYCLDNDIHIQGIESINPIAENLYDFQRDIIEDAFNCRVFEEYCCNDGGACAWECETREGLHYFMERAIIEEFEGEMIVTDLWNLAMPFIRYRNGDSVQFLDKKCSCGRHLPLIKVKGRTNDIIITPENVVSPTFIMVHGIGGYMESKQDFRPGIHAVQYVQKTNYRLEINIIRNPWCSETEIVNFKEKLARILTGMELKISFVEDLPKTAKGKRQFIVNEDKDLLRKMGYLK